MAKNKFKLILLFIVGLSFIFFHTTDTYSLTQYEDLISIGNPDPWVLNPYWGSGVWYNRTGFFSKSQVTTDEIITLSFQHASTDVASHDIRIYIDNIKVKEGSYGTTYGYYRTETETLSSNLSFGIHSWKIEQRRSDCLSGYCWVAITNVFITYSIDQTAPTINSVTASSPSCEVIRFTIDAVDDPGGVGLADAPYSFDAGYTWQAENYKDYSGTSKTIPSGKIAVKDKKDNVAYYYSSITGTAASCVEFIPPVISSVTPSSPACEVVRFTVTAADEPGGSGLHSTAPYSFDAGATWQAAKYKDYSGTSKTINAGNIKVRDNVGNIATYNQAVSGTAASCSLYDCDWCMTHGSGNCPTECWFDAGVGKCLLKGWAWDSPTSQCIEAPACIDSDGGENIYTYGEATGYDFSIHTTDTWADNCNPGDETQIGEVSCIYDSTAEFYHLYRNGLLWCPAGYVCQNGACVSDIISPTVNAFAVDGHTSNFDTCDETLTITWTVSDTGGSGLKQVEVWYSQNGGPWTEVLECRDTSVSGNGPVSGSCTRTFMPGYDYEIGIHVLDEAGNMGTEGSTITASINTIPAAPTNLTFTDVGPDYVTFTWTDNSTNEAGFNIYRNWYGSTYAWQSANDTDFTDENAACNTQYQYGVTAVNECGESDDTSGYVTTLSCEPDFTISALPVSQTKTSGQSADYTVTLTSYLGFSSSVALSVLDCPAGASCSFAPGSVIPTGSSTFTVSNAPYSATPYTLNLRGIGGGKTHTTQVQLTINDGTIPTVDEFTVNGNDTDFSTEDTSLDVAWTVSDTGGSGLKQAEVWSSQDSGSWTEQVACRDTSISGNGPESGGCTIDVECGHIYEYGIHAVDEGNNVGTETTSGLATITAYVNCPGANPPPIADFSVCKVAGTQTVRFTNLSTDPDFDTLTYTWDFNSLDGVDLPDDEDSTAKNPEYDYTGIVQASGATRLAALTHTSKAKVAGVAQLAQGESASGGEAQETEEVVDKLKNKIDVEKIKTWLQSAADWLKNIWQKIAEFFKNIFSKDAQAQGEWWDSDWSYRRTITFDNSTRGQLDDIPFLVKLTSANFDFSLAKSKGQDIRFIDADGVVELDYEIESWDAGVQQAAVWVNVPRIDASSATDHIYMYYGNISADDNQNPTGVWDSNFKAVHHLEETDIDGGAGDITDSTGLNNGRTRNMESADQVVGKADGSFNLDGVNENVNMNDSASLDITNDLTLEAWIKPDTTYGWRNIVSKSNWSEDQYKSYHFYLDDAWCGGREIGFNIVGANPYPEGYTCSNPVIATSTWAYVVGVFDAGVSRKVYINGVDETRSTSGNLANNIQNVSIGAAIGSTGPSYSSFFDGQIDEVRISNTNRSADWIAFQYCATNQTCLTYSTQEMESLRATLRVDDGEDSHTVSKIIDLDTMDECEDEYNLINVNDMSCNYMAGTWEKREDYLNESDYAVYRCQGNSAYCSSATNYSVVGATKSCGATNCLFDDTSVEENTFYYYYINTPADDLNNSTDSPDCRGSTGATICPLGADTPLCPQDVTGLSINRHCGDLTISWDDMGANAYRVYKCLDRGSEKCSNVDYFYSQSEQIYDDSGTSYEDEEVIPVNIVNPADVNYYCYKVIAQMEPEDDWPDLPEDPVCDYSYCYRGPGWQER